MGDQLTIIHHLIMNIIILHLVLIMILKVGTEWVYKGQNADNCLNAVAALARTMYNRLFLWLVDLCNRTLIDQTMKVIYHDKMDPSISNVQFKLPRK